MRITERITYGVKQAVQDVLRLNASTGETLNGTDHSHYDWVGDGGIHVPIQYDTAHGNGMVFAILKVVNGAIIQSFAEEEFARANGSNELTIPYMWPYPVKYISAASQAQKYYQVMRKYPGRTIALDAEETPGYPNPQGGDHEAVIREYWKLVPGQKFILYSRLDYILSNGFNTAFFAQFPLWLARPGTYEPVAPSAWTKLGKSWEIWQNSWTLPARAYGVTNGKKAIDGNVFRGGIAELQALFGYEVTEPPTPEVKMNRVTIVYKDGANIRSAPVVSSSTYLRTVATGTVFETNFGETTDAAGSRWIRVTESPAEYACTYYGGVLRASVEPIISTNNPRADVRLTAQDGKVYSGSVELTQQ